MYLYSVNSEADYTWIFHVANYTHIHRLDLLVCLQGITTGVTSHYVARLLYNSDSMYSITNELTFCFTADTWQVIV